METNVQHPQSGHTGPHDLIKIPHRLTLNVDKHILRPTRFDTLGLNVDSRVSRLRFSLTHITIIITIKKSKD
jgi:hypothetical protein